MSYYNKEESNKRIAAVQAILEKKDLDAAIKQDKKQNPNKETNK